MLQSTAPKQEVDAALIGASATASELSKHACAAYWGAPLRRQLMQMTVNDYERMGTQIDVLRAELAGDV